MKFINNSVIDLMVFDENENLVVKLDTLSNSSIFYEKGAYYLGINDAVFNFNLQKFLHEEERISDFKLAIKGFQKTLKIKVPKTKKCKLIGTAIASQLDDKKDLEVVFESHNATINNEFRMDFSNTDLSEFEYIFEIDFDQDGDYFKINMK